MPTPRQTLDRLIRSAMHGDYDPTRLPMWLQTLRNAVGAAQPSDASIRASVSRWLTGRFKFATSPRHAATVVPGIGRFTIDMVEPQLRAELDRKILQSIDLIKLDRDERVAQTTARFAGWLSSVPPGGSTVSAVRRNASAVLKPTLRQRFEQRRVEIDQGHKLISAVDETLAQASGAIAGRWEDRGVHDKSYDARPAHLARSGKIFVVRGSWADAQKLITHPNGYMDEIERPGELPFCSCAYFWITALSSMPRSMLTAKGRGALASLRIAA